MRFEQLRAACRDVGLHAERAQFDCGERVSITDDNKVIAHAISECGDAETATDRVARELVTRKYLLPWDVIEVLDIAAPDAKE